MMRQFNWVAAIAGILVWIMVRTVGLEFGLGGPISGLGGAILGVMVYFAIDDYWHKKSEGS